MIYREPKTEGKESRKPIPLRATFILSALKVILAFTFFFVFKDKPDAILPANLILFTAIAYLLSFFLLVFSILSKNVILYRSVMVGDILVSLPAKAYIGIVFAVISLGLSMHPKVRAYFAV